MLLTYNLRKIKGNTIKFIIFIILIISSISYGNDKLDTCLKKELNKQIVKCFQSYANKDNLKAQVLLGDSYSFGRITEVDGEKAFYWYKKAALQEDSYASRMLALMYKTGFGVKKDTSKAISWHKKAANLGSEESSFDLASMYLENKNYKEAVSWFEKGAKKAHKPSIFNLGQIYLSKKFGFYNEEKAFEYLIEAARLDHRESQKLVAFMYKKGMGTKKSSWKSKFWLDKFKLTNEEVGVLFTKL